jgi:hypothetical protein
MAENINILTPVPGIENLTYEDANTLLNFQRIWLDNIHWFRNFSHSSLRNIPDQTAIEEQLFQKLPKDIYNEFSKYFGEEEAQQFLNFYSRFIMNNWQTVIAYRNNDEAAINFSIDQWNQTADELAEFLSGLDSHLSADQWKVLFRNYIKLKIKEITAFLAGDYDSETKIYVELEDVVSRIASSMAMSIIRMRHNRQSA